VSERAEEAVVSKEARVVEEVVVGKDGRRRERKRDESAEGENEIVGGHGQGRRARHD
jgi:hypothetical protein